MLPDRSHWVALTVMGGAVVIQGALDLTTGTPFFRAAIMWLSGVVLIGSGSVGIVRSQQTSAESTPVTLRALAVLGAVLYISLTVFRVIR